MQQTIILMPDGSDTTWRMHRSRCTPPPNTTAGSPNPNRYSTEHHIHGQFESEYVRAHIAAKDFASLVKAPERLNDPFADSIAYLKNSNAPVETSTNWRRPVASRAKVLPRRLSSPRIVSPDHKSCSISGIPLGSKARCRLRSTDRRGRRRRHRRFHPLNDWSP